MSDAGFPPLSRDLDFGRTIRGFAKGQKVFGRYELRRLEGRGGMALVWLAYDGHLREDIALKFLPELVRLDPISIEELKRETRRTRKLSHPNIVKVYDFVSNEFCAAISMEYVDGDTLAGLRARQDELFFEVGAISDWLRQMLNALSYAHTDAKIVHRDLKPANIMVDDTGKVKVTDFGIAGSINESVSRISEQRDAYGTLHYMSPQQAMGDPPSVSDDIYSLGATIYELLTSKAPFYRGDVLAQLREVTPPTITERRAELGIERAPVPKEWEETIAACLAKKTKDRPQDMVELAERLGLGPITTTPATKHRTQEEKPTPLTPKSPKNAQTAFGVILLFLLAALAVLGWYYGIEQPAEQEKLRQAQLAQQVALQKVRDAQAAQQKAQLEAQAKLAADEAAKLKAEADQKAAEEAAVAQAKLEADQKAAADAADQLAAIKKVESDAKLLCDTAAAQAAQFVATAQQAASDALAAAVMAQQYAAEAQLAVQGNDPLGAKHSSARADVAAQQAETAAANADAAYKSVLEAQKTVKKAADQVQALIPGGDDAKETTQNSELTDQVAQQTGQFSKQADAASQQAQNSAQQADQIALHAKK